MYLSLTLPQEGYHMAPSISFGFHPDEEGDTELDICSHPMQPFVRVLIRAIDLRQNSEVFALSKLF